jgi:hypothetical protein
VQRTASVGRYRNDDSITGQPDEVIDVPTTLSTPHRHYRPTLQ